MRRAFLVFAAWTTLSLQPALAQNWYDAVFPEKSHDFGTVARGSKLTFAFRLVNTTSYDIHIADARTKCGCTDVKIGARDIPPGTQTTIEAVLDTTKFQGYKASGLILVLDRPTFVEVDLNLNCFIRGDVMLNPGQVDLQVVPRGSSPSMNLTLSYYGGQPNWAVTKLTTISEHVTAQLREQTRQGGVVQYQLTATLNPSAPAGYFKDEITLHTNDPSSPTIPVYVSANVQSAVSIAPSVLNLGHLRPGQKVKKTVLVKSSKPFKITGVDAKKPDLEASSNLTDAKPFHTVTITLTAPSRPGPYNAELEIDTNLEGEPPAKLTTFATIVPAN